MRILFEPTAFEQYQSWMAKGTIKTLDRINLLIKDCQRSPFEGIGKPEPLRGNYAGSWSRRIDSEHRLIYAVIKDSESQTLVVLGCRGHYS